MSRDDFEIETKRGLSGTGADTSCRARRRGGLFFGRGSCGLLRAMRTLSLMSLLLLVTACGDDGHGDHDFADFAECYEHHSEESATDVAATGECDDTFELTHDDEADCLAEHTADVTDGVPQAAIDAHCATF